MSRWKRMTALLLALLLTACLFSLPAAGAETADSAAGQEESAVPAPSGTVLTVGSKGEAVTRLQQRLKDLGYLSGKVDGQYGGGTKRAVIAFQRRNGLETDGEAGPLTQAKLYSEDAVAAPENRDPVDVLSGELPLLVNQENTVDEFFTPADLVQMNQVLDSKLVKIKYKDTRGVRTAVEALGDMLRSAQEAGLKKWQVSAGYRSWDDQVSILNAKIRSYQKKNKDWSSSRARRAALKSVAEPGSSEHHLGLAFDVNVQGASSFASTKQSAWLNEHCWEFGFIIRYQKDKQEITGFVAEPWHVRYVGVEHALYMKENNLCLEEYLQGIRDGSIPVPEAEEEEDEVTEETEEPEASGTEEG